MPQCVEVYLSKAWVLKGLGDSVSLFHEAFAQGVNVGVEYEARQIAF